MKLPATEKLGNAYDWIRRLMGLTKPQPPVIPDKPKKKKVKKPPKHDGFDVLIQPEHLPKYLQVKECLGVYVGSCITRQDRRWRGKIKALDEKEKDGWHECHAHTDGWCKGFICIRDMKYLKRHATMRHELAHLLSADHNDNGGHNEEWATEFIKLCGNKYKYITMDYLAKKYGFKVKE